MNLVALLEQRAAEHPDLPALIDAHKSGDRVVTYGELAGRVAAGSAFLKRIGLNKGMTVMAFHPVSIELYEFLLAAFHSGLQVMLADPSGGREFLSNCCARRQPDAFFGSWKANLLRLSNPALRAIPIKITAGAWFPGTWDWNPSEDQASIENVENDHPALITFTSGSTGQPKAAVRTHGFLMAQQRTLADSLRFRTGEVDLITLPVFVLANLASGMTSVLADTDLARPGKPDSLAILEQCRRYKVTRCAASPAFFEGLLKFPLGIPAFEQVFTGGAPVFPDLLERLQERLPDARIESVYGSTEAEPIAHLDAQEWDEATRTLTRRGGGLCAGPPVPQIQLCVIADQSGTPLGPLKSDQFKAMQMPAKEVGEIVVAGEHVLQGYLEGVGNEETKIQVDDTIWHRTGDAGWIDQDGRVWMLGRCSAKLPEFKSPEGLPTNALCYPFAIECALRERYPDIRMAALEWESKRSLAVGAKCSNELMERIREAALELGIAQCFRFDSLPLDRRHNAKIDYPALRELIRNRSTKH